MDWKKWLGLELTPERFARKVSKLIQTIKPGLAPVYEPENFRLKIGANNYFQLHNAYHAVTKAPRKHHDKILREFVAGILNPPAVPHTFEEVRPHLLPVLRRKSLLDDLKRDTPPAADDKGRIACRHFGPDVVLAMVIDAEQSMLIVMESELKRWGVTFGTALEAAMDNLRNRSIDNFGAVDGVPGLTFGNWHDAYDSSRILLPDLLCRGVASGNPVVMIPTRESLLLAPDNNAAAQLAMLAFVDQALQDSSRWCSTAMYQVVDGKLAHYEPQDAEVRDSLRTIERDVAMADYADQKEKLEAAYAREGQDIFVASFSLMKKDERIASYCTWTEEVSASVLPKTDIVVLGRGSGAAFKHVLVHWETLMARHPALLQDLSCFPPRYYVTTFPAALFDELAAVQHRETA